MERSAKMTIILGANGTGKTTLLKTILGSSSQKSLVITPDDAEWTTFDSVELDKPSDFIYKGIRRHIFNPEKASGTLKLIEYFKKGILVFDDCRGYLTAQTPPEVRQLLIRRRQREVDILAVGHGFTEVPPVFFTFATEIILFRTTDEIDRRKKYIKNFEHVKEAQARVNSKALKEPHYFELLKFL